MKMKRCIALILTLAMALSCVAISASAVSIEDNTNTENNQVSTAAIDYGTVTQNSDGSVMLNFGQDSITVKGNRGDIVTDSEHGGILRPDNLRTNDDSIAILTLPSVNLKNSGYDKLDLYVASEKNAAVVVKAGDTEIASISNINTSGWETFNVFTQTLTTTDAEGLITLNITGEGANTYCGNYIYVKLYNSQAATATPKPTTDPNLPTATPAPTTDPNQETPIYLDTNYTFEERAADLVSRMTLEEKVTQLTDEASAIPRLGVGAYDYWSEALHGVAREGKATSFPSPLSMSNTWNRALIFQMADMTSSEARAKHPRTKLSYWSPTINMARDPRWGRNEETFGEDPYLTTQLANEFVKGMQGDDEKYLKTISTLKHFVANNVESERSDGSSVMDETTLREYYSRAFQDIMEDTQPASVMSSYNATTISRNGSTLISREGQAIDYIASSANSYILLDLLRRNWGFTGYVTGDCAAFSNMNSKAALKKGLFRDRDIKTVPVEEVMPKAFLNGGDIDCSLSGGGGAEPDIMLAAIKGGYMTEDQLDVNLYRLFLTRMKTGEFDDGGKYQDIKTDIIESDEHVAVAEALAEESWVLLKNDDNTLPLKSEDKNIVVVGPYSAQVILGDYSGVPTKTVTPFDGIKSEVENTYPGSNVKYIGSVSDATPLFNIKSINLIDSSNKKTTLDLSKATISGATLKDGIITDVTRTAKISFPSIDFSKVKKVNIEIATGSQPGGSIDIHYGIGGPKEAAIKSETTSDLNTYKECSGDYTGADGGYNGVNDMELTINANEPAFAIDKYNKDDLDKADIIIAYTGTMFGREPTGDSGESNDRESIDLPKNQSHVTVLTDAYPDKTVVAMQAVGQLNVEPFMNKCKAMLWTSYNGQTQGTAIGKVLTGQVNPSGKLTTTWYKSAALKNMPFNAKNVNEGGITFKNNDYSIKSSGTYPGRTYQYHTGNTVYPFGYGLSYTNFEYSNLKVDNSTVDANGKITFTVDIKNTGSAAGKEAAQLYVSVPGADGLKLPKQQLKGFDKVELQPGETKNVSIELNIEDLKLFDETNQKVYVNAGEYTAKIAKNADDAGVSTKFNVTGTLKSELKNVTAIPNSVKVHGLIREDGTAHESITTIDSDLSAIMTDEAWFDLKNADKVEYTSSNPEIASVDTNGIVSSGTKSGIATITATVTVGGITKSSSYPVVNELKIKPSAEEIAEAKANLKFVYDKLPKQAYSDTNLAEIEKIYNAANESIDKISTRDELSTTLAKAINDLNSVPMDNLADSYKIVSENPNYIEKGVIDYREGGIPMYNGAEGTVTNINPYTGIQLQAYDNNGNVIDNSKLVWQIQKFDDSVRKVADIDNETGILTIYGNGIIQVTAANVEEMTCGTLMVQINMQVEGEYVDISNGADLTDAQSGTSGGKDAGSTGDAWIEYKSIKLSNLNNLIVRYAGKNAGNIYVSLDKNTDTGNLIASASLAGTGGWNKWTEKELTLDKTAIDQALLNGKLDKYGCATVYIQTNGTNLDYFRLNYIENNDDEPYVVDKVLNKANGKMKITLSYRGSALATPVTMMTAAYDDEGALKNIATADVKGTGEYEIDTGASDGDKVNIFIWNSLSDIKPLAQKVEKTYKTPVDSEIVVYSLDSKDFDYTKLTSAADAPDGQPYGTVNGLSGYSTLQNASSSCEYTYTDVNEKTYNYKFTKSWKGGAGSETQRCLYFTPKAPCKVTVLFDGGEKREQYIVQNGEKLAKGSSVSGKKTAFSAEITDISTPVYTYGSGSNKFVSAIIVEYYGTSASNTNTELNDNSIQDSNTNNNDTEAAGEDRPVQFTKWGNTDVVLTKNDVTGETKVFTIAAGGIRMQLSTDFFYESDIDFQYGDKFTINNLAEYKGRLYAGCDDGLVIVFTDCMKCYKLKKAADIDIKEMRIENGIMYLSDGNKNMEINMSDIGGDSIEADEAETLVYNGGIFVDVRSAEEFAEKSVEGSVNIPVDTIEEGLSAYSKDTVLIFYCSAGSRAEKALKTAKEMGFTNVYNLGSIDKLI